MIAKACRAITIGRSNLPGIYDYMVCSGQSMDGLFLMYISLECVLSFHSFGNCSQNAAEGIISFQKNETNGSTTVTGNEMTHFKRVSQDGKLQESLVTYHLTVNTKHKFPSLFTRQ